MIDSVPIIEANNITKRYGALTAVENLDLKVPSGVCFGLLGPNGAGKTTLVEIIEGIIAPTSGRILYQGKPRTASFFERIGIMFQQTALLSFMSVYETLRTFQSLYPQYVDIEELIQMCSLEEIRKQLNDKISGGQRQRLLLALALINQPALLFLDEPSTGLDPQARRNLWDLVEGVKQQGKTIILTTHYMEEAQQLCDVVAIMDHGRIIAEGPPEELIKQHTQGINIILPADAAGSVSEWPMAEAAAVNNRIIIQVKDMNATIQKLLAAGIDLSRMDVQSPTLETVFLNLTGRQLRD
ncbi:MAG: ABC transporter ATP-binding protein [Desulfobacteraceae bacterium]|nr:MAG: ABC transporter ATP-binding protein [Desulfobacteraceae bacterium]